MLFYSPENKVQNSSVSLFILNDPLPVPMSGHETPHFPRQFTLPVLLLCFLLLVAVFILIFSILFYISFHKLFFVIIPLTVVFNLSIIEQ